MLDLPGSAALLGATVACAAAATFLAATACLASLLGTRLSQLSARLPCRWWRTPRRRQYIPVWVKQYVFARDRGRCIECHASTELEFDHQIPFSRGGSSGPNNLRLLCRACNRKKGARIA